MRFGRIRGNREDEVALGWGWGGGWGQGMQWKGGKEGFWVEKKVNSYAF